MLKKKMTSAQLEQHLAELKEQVVLTSQDIIDTTQQERNSIKDQIDALTRQLASLDIDLEQRRLRAQKAYNFGNSVKDAHDAEVGEIMSEFE